MWWRRHLHQDKNWCWCWNNFRTFYMTSLPANISYTNKYMVSSIDSGCILPTQGHIHQTRWRQASCGSSFWNQGGVRKGKWFATMCASWSTQTWETKLRQKLRSNFTCGDPIGDIAGTRNKKKSGSGNYIHHSAVWSRDAGWGVHTRRCQLIVHPYSTDLEEFLNKTSKDAGNPFLGKICNY